MFVLPVTLLHRSAYGVLVIIMGNSFSRRGSVNMPKAPVRQPSDGEVKVKAVDNLGTVPPSAEATDQAAVHDIEPVNVSTSIYIIMYVFCL